MNDVQHDITIPARPEEVYRLLADAARWPVIFAPTVHVEHLDWTETTERFRIWAVAGDEVKSWTSVRELHPGKHHIGFRQEVSQPPVAAMSGAWLLRALPHGGTEVVLEHSYRAVDDDPDDLAWIAEVTDRNSRAELANLQALAEQAADRAELELTFEDTVLVDGDLHEVYDFLYRAQLWPSRLPHVGRMTLTENEPGVQVMEMETVTGDGSRHTTKSVRVCFPDERIVYKQILTPPLMQAHTGEWHLEKTESGVSVTSRHTVVIRPEAIGAVLGADATVADGLTFLRDALGGNSRITLEHAKAYAEGRQNASQARSA